MMGVSWQDAQDTPIAVVVRDLQYREVEQKVEKHFNEKQNNA